MASRLALSWLRSPVLPVSLLLYTAHTLHKPHTSLDTAVAETSKPRKKSPPPDLFPPTLTHPSGATLTLLGKGIRTVTFMRIKVYEVAFYADLNNVRLEEGEKSAGERMKSLLEGTDCLLRIVPTRQTNFTHLRDGFLKALQHRLTLLPSQPPESTQLALGKLLTLFPNTPMSPSQALDIAYFHPGRTQVSEGGKEWTNEEGTAVGVWKWRTSRTEGWPEPWLDVRCDGKEMGRVTDGWVARNWVEAYFDEKREISKGLRESVQQKLNELAKAQPARADGSKPVKLNWIS